MNAAYFIAKFEGIPEEKWIVGAYGHEPDGPHCAMGHCRAYEDAESPEANALRQLCVNHMGYRGVVVINDGQDDRYPQPTPKQRVLAWLRDAQAAGL